MILLRTLTEKSSLEGITNSAKTVGRLMESKPYELVRIYYTREKINFNTSVIAFLKEKFYSFFEIEKPGIFKDWKNQMFEGLDLEYKSYEELQKIMAAKRLNGQKIDGSLFEAYSKKKFQRINQKYETPEPVFKKEMLRNLNQRKK